MPTEVDYTKYSITQLLDVKEHIDPEAAPENYRNLLRELDQRSEELAEHKADAQRFSRHALFRKTRLVAYYQLLCGGIFILILFFGLLAKTLPTQKALSALSVLLIITLQFAAGWMLLKGKTAGYWLTHINQFAQLVGFSVGGFVYRYCAMLSIGPIFEPEITYFGIHLNPGIFIGRLSVADPGFVSINLLALTVILIISKRQELNDPSAKSAE